VSRRARLAVLLFAGVIALVAGCVSRVAPHDEEIARGLAGLQSSCGQFLDELHRTAGTPEAAWECHTAWYENTREELGALRVRAASYGTKNDATVDSLDLLRESVERLEIIHAGGVTAGEVAVLHTMLDAQLDMLIRFEAAKRPAGPEVTP